ncbi:TNT domain-containing protein [Streptoalloteichus tenebrarius]|uniref:TNT domain-containing protein n=1 Tax=Streptoalloteichus tenebrarius (strain ATCC 17920 / DSM 40477 / JCM 4838 / CBS 697.72 / NBRC 16177 / NCIMB 11028 / NRRL B-12390 / A12253. 1 / ISP 5477) TaxID=1933 RepID=UPI003555BEF6
MEEEYIPQAGEVWDRFGGPTGTFLSHAGTAFEKRALPPGSLHLPYHVYRWVKKWDGSLGIIWKGEIAPGFRQVGGGIQFRLDGMNVKQLCEAGYIIPVNKPHC